MVYLGFSTKRRNVLRNFFNDMKCFFSLLKSLDALFSYSYFESSAEDISSEVVEPMLSFDSSLSWSKTDMAS